ncbi:MAG: VWA domain-containing protein [Acidimicrobiia bacterium]
MGDRGSPAPGDARAAGAVPIDAVPAGAVPAGAVPADAFVLGFVHALRTAGLPIDLGRVLAYRRALTVLDLAVGDAAYWAGRATLVDRPESVPAYDATFAAWWAGRPAPETGPADDHALSLALDDDVTVDGDAAAPGVDRPFVPVRWSPAAVLRKRSFASYTDDEREEARRLIARIRLDGATRRSRRTRPVRSERGRPDPRSTVRAAVRTHGEVIHRPSRRRRDVPRRIVMMCDVSGSMDPYTRALVRLAHALSVGARRVEVFTIGTETTRITRELRSRDPDAAVAAAARRVPDWSGGTRLGDDLRTFNDRWGVRGVARGAIVVIVSDGWDRGDAALLGREMQRLARVAHRIVWVNPLAASPGFAPLAKGMAAAMPYVDELVAGHSLASLDAVLEAVAR